MGAYLNKSGASGVVEYEIGRDYIKVKFQSSNYVYLYNYKIPGVVHVEAMKRKAIEGFGLATYISTCVKPNYFSKKLYH